MSYTTTADHVAAVAGVHPDAAVTLDALEAAWRRAAAQDDQTVYRLASDALTGLLVHVFGEADGTAIRDLMADNWEGWVWNAAVVADAHVPVLLDCGECGEGHYRVPSAGNAVCTACGNEVHVHHDIARHLDAGESVTVVDGLLAYTR